MSSASRTALPIEGAELRPAGPDDAAELLVLQRCCWVEEAIANDLLDIAALHESLDDVRAWIDEWTTWCVRVGPRLVGAVRAKREGDTWEIGRLMVAPDLAGQGLGGWLLRYAEAAGARRRRDDQPVHRSAQHPQHRDVRTGRLPPHRRTGPSWSRQPAEAPRHQLARRPSERLTGSPAGRGSCVLTPAGLQRLIPAPARKSCRSGQLCAHPGRTSAAEGAHGQVGDERGVDAGAGVVVLQGAVDQSRDGGDGDGRIDVAELARRRSPPPRARPRPVATGWPCDRSRHTGPARPRPRRPRTTGRRAQPSGASRAGSPARAAAPPDGPRPRPSWSRTTADSPTT